MKGMITLYSWKPHQDSECWKQDPYVLYSDLSEYTLGGEAEEALVQSTGYTRKGDAT